MNNALAQARAALELAHTFIRNGIEFGYIKDTANPDWREALRETRAAMDALKSEKAQHYRSALEAILRQPQETMSDGKAVAAMVRIARTALKEKAPAGVEGRKP